MKTLAADVRTDNLASLESTLKAAGAQFWPPEEVEKHKAKELSKAPPASALWPYFETLSGINRTVLCESQTIMVVSGGVTTVAVLIFIFGGLISLLFGYNFLNQTTGGIMIVGALALGLLAISYGAYELSHALGKIHMRGPAKWLTYQYNNYHLSLPGLVETITREARMFRPEADIKIHALMQDDRILDPVLEIDGVYCLVWNGDTIIPPPQA